MTQMTGRDMTDEIALVRTLADGIRRMTPSGADTPAVALERYVAGELGRCTPEKRLRLLELLLAEFEPQHRPDRSINGHSPGTGDITRLVSQFLGKEITPGDSDTAEIAATFAASLNTLFDTLNEIITVINVTLLGRNPELETIRKVIGANFEEGRERGAIGDYLDQIKLAFRVAHTSFQAAATSTVAELLKELDPELLSREKGTGLKFGPLRKAEQFEQYEEKYARCRRWFDSGQFKEQLLRSFENNCQKTLQTPKR